MHVRFKVQGCVSLAAAFCTVYYYYVFFFVFVFYNLAFLHESDDVSPPDLFTDLQRCWLNTWEQIKIRCVQSNSSSDMRVFPLK